VSQRNHGKRNLATWQRTSQRKRGILTAQQAAAAVAELAQNLDSIIERLNAQRHTQNNLAAALQMQRIRAEVLAGMLTECGVLPIGEFDTRVQRKIAELALQVRAAAEAAAAAEASEPTADAGAEHAATA